MGVGITFAGGALNSGKTGGGNAPSVLPDATRAAAIRSAAPSVDTKEPQIHISRPEPGSVVYGETTTLRGRTEPGATLTISDETLRGEQPATVESDGTFEAQLGLGIGENSFLLSSQDAAGNQSSTRLVLTRATSLASAVVNVSADELRLESLPASINVVAVVRDEQGVASDGAEAIISLSPPNGSTQTYETVTANGEARWTGMVVSGDRRAIGKWLVTVRVTMPSGEELRDDAFFIVR